ncbi:MAG: hypothetical protein A3G41_04445 [Elusimicrobia bacterium RIFCSPLOWO2_12_FULL_59_9]|nr:MAG: hypothetical protein A3G41_04445 [Elusimicrobia bacterium RIFCSPLOWO2_12_FULL_59_9]
MAAQEPGVESKEELASQWEARLANLQQKIDVIDQQLEAPKMPVKKRAKLEAKLKKLLKEKDQLLETGPAKSKKNLARQGEDQPANLQEKIDAINRQIEDPNIPAKKRAKLEAKLKKLLKEKDQLSETTRAKQKPRARKQTAVYACPMGDYRGPMTSDGRCPKCGMTLQKQQ